MAVFLLSLPGSAWAQAALSGQVKFSDGSAAAGVTVVAYSPSSDTSSSATVDASGAYVLHLTPGTYNIGVGFSSSDGYCSQVLLSSYTVGSNAQLNLGVPDLTLNGRIVNSAGQPVAGAQLSGYGTTSQNGSCVLYPYSGTDGRFHASFPAPTPTCSCTPPPAPGTCRRCCRARRSPLPSARSTSSSMPTSAGSTTAGAA
ncbi:carboxypeptidase-like regulatory domain-containing protein [Vitiosangium sp. GDMCC 1.1324]|uniref:carboxypeptidase-like regulatory domain-containing protein n=1 Tax=Vitiosangium sp. (strain GDMCC 1.1324) TaxID=2138576 RepID=UPI0018EEC917|nr:carboxypeptidase-like regulatory domain-containing protein [Vitiosangium sp. GDMCC 1.1324]